MLRGSGMVCGALWLGGEWFVYNTAAAMMDGHSRSIANHIESSDRPSSAGRELGKGVVKFRNTYIELKCLHIDYPMSF
jgi:hypothetical protein